MPIGDAAWLAQTLEWGGRPVASWRPFAVTSAAVFPGAGDRTLFKLAIDHVMISRAGSPSGLGFKVDDSGFLVEGSLRDRCRIRVCIEGTGHSFPVIL